MAVDLKKKVDYRRAPNIIDMKYQNFLMLIIVEYTGSVNIISLTFGKENGR